MMKSIATLEMEPRTGVNFTQIAGCDEAKLELYEGKFNKFFDTERDNFYQHVLASLIDTSFLFLFFIHAL